MPPCRGAISVENLALVNKRGERMKRFFLSFLMLLTLINWFHTHAEAQATVAITTDSTLVNGNFEVTITFSEAVTGFARTDITVIGGTSVLSSFKFRV